MINSIGIVGQGFVGTAVNVGMSPFFQIKTFDLIEEKSTAGSLSELYHTTDIIFVCVPTPMKKDGKCDLSIVDQIFSQLNSFGTEKIVILKSTVPPGTCNHMQEKYPNIDIIFSPEFLTEANAINDFINQDRVVLGGRNQKNLDSIYDIFRKVFPKIPIIKTDTKTAEMVKYVANCFLAVKVSFANQIFDVCKSSGVDYDAVTSVAKLDKRLGNSHWKVPGPDGDRGYGGHCFPKDMSAFLSFAKENGASVSLIDQSISYNDTIRTKRDWETMIGRAVSNN